MQINKKFESEKDFLDYAWSLINFNGKIWRDEDLPKLKPFFNYDEERCGEWRGEVVESYEFYRKCCFDYSNDLTEIRDSIRGFDSVELYEFFFLVVPIVDCYNIDEDGNDLDENGNILPPNDRDALRVDYDSYEITFPMTFVGWIECEFDRHGKDRIMFSDFVKH